MIVENQLDVKGFDRAGNELPEKTKLIVRNALIRERNVELEIAGLRIKVNADELHKAINNATNS